jgi:hypothetical protein
MAMKILDKSQGTENVNLIVTQRRRPTKEANIPFTALRKDGDAVSLSKNPAPVVIKRKEGAKIRNVAAKEPGKP